MKYIKITAIVFTLSLCFAFYNAVAATNSDYFAGFSDVTIKNFSSSTTISTHYKNNYGYQSAYKTSALDDLSGDDRAMQGQITDSAWIDLPTGQYVHWTDPLTYFQGVEYTHYIKAKKSTLSTVSYWGQWIWDKEM